MRWMLGCLLFICLGAARAGEYTVGVEELDYYPHYRTDAKREFSGYARAVLDAFAKDKGHQISYRPLPVNRLYAELIGDKIDFKYPDNAYWGQDAKAGSTIVYSDPVVPYVDGLLVLPARRGSTDIKTIGSIAGFTPFTYLDGIKSGQYKLEERNSMEQLLRGVLLGRIESAYVNIDVGLFALKALGEDGKLVFNDAMPAARDHYHLSTIKQAAVVEEFNAWLKSNTATLAALRAEYGLAQ